MESTELDPVISYFRKIIGLVKPWYITKIETDHSGKQITIYIDFRRGSKFPSKGSDSNKTFPVHGTKIKVWRHLNIVDYKLYLHCRVPRIILEGGKTQVIDPPFAGLSNGFTLLFEAYLLRMMKGMTAYEVGSSTNELSRKLWDTLDRYILKGRSLKDFSGVRHIGTDETAKARGHDYITLFVDLETKTVLFITEGKGKKTIKKFVEDLLEHNGKIENIVRISIDLSPAFIAGVKKYLPFADITFDRFHVTKIINEGVDKVRRSEATLFPVLLKKARYVVLKNEENLTAKQKKKLRELRLSKVNLKTLRAMQMRENFQAIYKAETKEEFTILLKKWYFWVSHSRIPEMVKAAKTIKKHWPGIINWYESQINTGMLEGINSMAQGAKTKARGYRTFKNFANIIYLLKGNLNFFAFNKYYQHEV